MLLVKTPLQPPLPLAVANQVANAAFTAVCVWQAAVVVFTGQVSTTGGLGILTVTVSTSPSSSPILPLFGVESASASALAVTWAKLVITVPPAAVTVAWKVSTKEPPFCKKRFCHFKPVVAGAPFT